MSENEEQMERQHLRRTMPTLIECVRDMALSIDEGLSETGRELSQHLGAAMTAAYRLRLEGDHDGPLDG